MRTESRRVLLRLAAFCGAAMTIVSSWASASTPKPALSDSDRDRPHIVGRLESVSIGTAHPYRAQRAGETWTRTLYDPGATYIRVHFAHFELAEGDRLEITGAGGQQRRIYSGRGPRGTGEFWAFAVAGDTAVVTLFASVGGGDGFEIDAYGRGIEPILPAGGPNEVLTTDRFTKASDPATLTGPSTDTLEPDPSGLICGDPDWSDVACYRYNHVVDSYNARAAVLALSGCCSASTAFKVSDSGQFLGAYRSSVADVELHMDYQNVDCDGPTATETGVVMGDTVLRSDPISDFTLFTTVGDSSAIPCLQLDRRLPALGEPIYIPEHPWGGPKKIAIYSDLNAGVCRVDPLGPIALVPQTSELGYLCDTAEGSLGAPVVSRATQRVVGISHRGHCPNAAARMDLIWPKIAGVAGSCSNGFPCQPVSGARCDCNGVCTSKERNYNNRGGMCSDCWEEPSP